MSKERGPELRAPLGRSQPGGAVQETGTSDPSRGTVARREAKIRAPHQGLGRFLSRILPVAVHHDHSGATWTPLAAPWQRIRRRPLASDLRPTGTATSHTARPTRGAPDFQGLLTCAGGLIGSRETPPLPPACCWEGAAGWLLVEGP